MNPRNRTLAWLGGGVALVVAGTVAAFLLARFWPSEPPPKLVISRETTFWTGPLRPDGGIDWVAALRADSNAEGLTDEENGAPLLEEALKGWNGLYEFAKARDALQDLDPLDREQAVLDAIADGRLEAQEAALGLAWVEACAPALEKARRSTERPSFLLIASDGRPHFMATDQRLPQLPDLMRAFQLRIAANAEKGAIDATLTDIATACVLARRVGSPVTFAELTMSAGREVAVLEIAVRCVRRGTALPATRALAVVGDKPARWTGESALGEALRAERVVVTRLFDDARLATPESSGGTNHGKPRIARALASADPNMLFRRLQQTYDELDRALLDTDRPARSRIDAFEAVLARLIEAGRSIEDKEAGPLGLGLVSDEELAVMCVDSFLRSFSLGARLYFRSWLSVTARRDALLAELAFLAGAPERRDSWLGEPLVVTRKEDGSIEVGGALIELARARGENPDEE